MRSRKPIAIDLDGVVVDLVSTMLPKLSELAGRSITADDIHVFNIAQALDLTNAAEAELWDWLESERLYARAPAIEGAVTTVRALGPNTVRLVTSRPHSLRGQTLEWLTAHGLGGYHLEMGLPTQKVVETDHFYALVEDNADHLASVASHIELVLLYDQPWNRAAPALANVVRVRDWTEIAGLLLNQR